MHNLRFDHSDRPHLCRHDKLHSDMLLKYVRKLACVLQEIPSDLQTMCDAFTKKRETGLAQAHGSGYGGSGFKFDAHEENKRLAERKALMAEYKQAWVARH